MASVLERFEAVGALYYRRYRQLRPGKDSSPHAYRGQNADRENVEQFDTWVKTLAFDDAIDRIVEIEDRLKARVEDDADAVTQERLDFLLQNAQTELRDGLYFEVKGDDLRIIVEALKRLKDA